MQNTFQCFDGVDRISCESVCRELKYSIKLSFVSLIIFILLMASILSITLFVIKYLRNRIINKKKYQSQHIQCNMDSIIHHVTIHPDESFSVSIHE